MTRVGMDVKNFTKGSKRIKGEYDTISRKFQRSSGGISKTIGAGMSLQASALRKLVGGYAGWAGAVTAAGYAVSKATKETMLEDAALGQINFLLGTSAQAFEDWADTQAAAYGMAKTDAIRFGAVYANLVSVFASDTAQATTMTEDLLKSSAVVASASGRSMTDVMERIRSGMLGNTEAIEDLGVNVQANALQETEAFKKMGKGAKNWDSIKSQTLKQQIRYYAILEQVQNRFGTKLRDNVSTRMMIFQAKLKDLTTNIGGMFIPILNAVLPVLTRMTTWLAAGAKVAAEFMHALFGYKPKGAEKNLKNTKKKIDDVADSAKNAAKEVKGALAPFDKINVLSSGDNSNKDSANQSGAQTSNQMDTGGGTAQLFNFSKKMKKIADNVRKILGGMFNNPTFQKYYKLFVDLFVKLGKILVDHFKGYWKLLTGGAGKKFFKGLQNLFEWIYPIVKFVIDMLLEDLAMLLSGMRKIFEGLLNFFGGLLTGDWATMWKGFKQILLGSLKVAWIAIQYVFGEKIFGIVFKFFGKFGKYILSGGAKMLKPFTKLFKWMKDVFVDFFKNMFKGTGGIASRVSQSFKDLVELLKIGFQDFVKDVVKAFKNNKLFQAFVNLGKKLWGGIKSAFGALGKFLVEFWNKEVAGWAKLFEFVKIIGTYAWNAIKGAFGKIGTFLVNFWKAEINGGLKIFDFVKRIGIYVWDAIKGGFSSFTSFLSEHFNVFKLGKDLISKMAEIGKKLWDGLKSGFSSPKDWFKGVINAMIDMMNGFIKTVNETLSFEIRGKKFGVNIPNIPRLATGGVIDSPTIAMVGEAGKEAVMPLENNTGWITELAGKLNAQSKGSAGDIVINIGGTELARIVAKEINRANLQSGKSLILT